VSIEPPNQTLSAAHSEGGALTPYLRAIRALQGVDVLRADLTESTRTMQTAASLLDSPAAAELTARRLGPGWTRPRVQSAVEVETKGQSNVLSVVASAEEPSTAARLANTFARAALDARSATVKLQARNLLAILDRNRPRARAAARPPPTSRDA